LDVVGYKIIDHCRVTV